MLTERPALSGFVQQILRAAKKICIGLFCARHQQLRFPYLFWLWRVKGTGYLARRARKRLRGERRYDRSWIQTHDTLSLNDIGRISKRIAQLGHRPVISIIMPVYNTRLDYLRDAIESVLAQLYENWELCIADDCSTGPQIRSLLTDYAANNRRIKVIFRETTGHVSEASNSALAVATGSFVAFLDDDDLLAPHALYMIAEEINAHPDANLIYSDEDKINHRQRYEPYFKPDWNPDLFLSQNYLNHLTVYRRMHIADVGGFRSKFDGSQDYDLALRVIERIPPDTIRHIPFVLYHWRSTDMSVASKPDQKPFVVERARVALREHLARCAIVGTVEPSRRGHYHRVRRILPPVPPKVSLIIPTRDRVELLQGAINSIFDRTDYPAYEIIIVDNQSTEAATLAYFSRASADPKIKLLHYDHEFNFSAIINFAVRHTTGKILGFLNNDIRVINNDWLSEMVSHAIRPEVGAVGAMLYYPDDTVQHAGIVLGVGEAAVNCFTGVSRKTSGYFAHTELIQNYSAVTAACMVTRATVFKDVDGFNERDLPIAFNDVDYCLRLREKGYLVTWTPYAELYHLESASRAYDLSPREIRRSRVEQQYLATRWANVLTKDPYYNPNLSLEGQAFTIANQPRVHRPWTEV